jgi:hypothetical protein
LKVVDNSSDWNPSFDITIWDGLWNGKKKRLGLSRDYSDHFTLMFYENENDKVKSDGEFDFFEIPTHNMDEIKILIKALKELTKNKYKSKEPE